MHSSIKSQTAQVDDPVNTILNDMAGQSITQGWDVICAMEADKINELFAQQYAIQVYDNKNLSPINGTVPMIGATVEFIELVLGPPLISFLPDSNDAALQINFISGTVNILGPDNNTILASQSISPGDGYQISGIVPLTSVEGEVENGRDVVLDINNGASFAAHLNFPSGAETILGQYFLDFLKQNASNFKYSLGTLVCDAAGTNLTPVMFDLATQINSQDKNDTGRLLLFIATTYNPNGGEQASLGIADIVPDGCASTLIVSSQAVFQGVLKSYYESTFSKANLVATAQANDKGVYSMTVTGGQIDIGVVKEQQNTYSGIAYYWSGSNNWPNTPDKIYSNVVIPLSGIQFAIQDNTHLNVNANLAWNQSWGVSYPQVHTEGYHATGTLGMNASISGSLELSVDSAQQTVNFNGTPTINVPDPNGSSVFSEWTMGDQLAQDIANQTNANLTALFSGGLPPINTLAVSNLLFPTQHILNFQQVYLPGDLVIFGDIYTTNLTTSPVSAIVAAGQTLQFTANNSQSATVTWNARGSRAPWGQISASGEYTAPSRVSKPQPVLITAKISDTQYSSSIVMLVPEGVLVAPSVVIVQNSTPQSFVASVGGEGNQPVTWSINPKGVGTIATDDTTFVGTYTPPASVQAPTAVTITATSQANSNADGTALAIVLTGLETGVMVSSPSSATLQPNQTQQFVAKNKAGKQLNPTWSVFSTASSAGSINNGNYIAPEGIANSEIVVVVATLEDDVTGDTLVATSLVYLEPPTND